MNVWSMLLGSDPPPPPDTFRTGPWDDLASIKWRSEELGLMGPNGSFCLQSPLLFGKARRGRKFEHEDSAQIAVTLASEGNQGQESEKELGRPPPVVRVIFLFPSRENTAHMHTDMRNQHILYTARLCAEQKSTWTHLQLNTQRGADTHAHVEPPRKHHNCTHKQFRWFTLHILWCFVICIPMSLLLRSLSIPALTYHTHTHTQTWLKDIDKICYNELLP